MITITNVIIIIFILLFLMDLYRLFNFIKFCLKFFNKKNIFKIKEKFQEARTLIKIKKINNILNLYKNIKKIFQSLNFESFNFKRLIPIIFCLLFSDSFSISSSESPNNIHHYVLDDKGELLEVTDEEEKIRMKKQEISDEIRKQREEEDERLWQLFWLALIVFGISMSILIYLYFNPEDPDNTGDGKKVEGNPDSEPYLTPYLKKWQGQEERLHNKTNPFYTGTCTGKKYEHFSPEYVDKYNEFIREWEDDHIYCHSHSQKRYWRKNKNKK